jgi:hypothetical protein
LICDGRPRYVYHTFDENRRISGDSWEFPWGPKAFVDGCMTLEPITEGLIVASERALEKRQLFIGFAWDRVAYLWTNFANCVHCSPMFGDIAPGEQAVRRGKVYVGEDMESLVARYRKDFPGRGRPGKV